MTTRTITVEALAAALHACDIPPSEPYRSTPESDLIGHAKDAAAIFAALPAEPAGATGLREALERALRPFVEGAAQWSSDPEISREAQRILNWLDDPERAALTAEPAGAARHNGHDVGYHDPACAACAEPAGAGLREALDVCPFCHQSLRTRDCGHYHVAGSVCVGHAATPVGESEHWRGADGGERE